MPWCGGGGCGGLWFCSMMRITCRAYSPGLSVVDGSPCCFLLFCWARRSLLRHLSLRLNLRSCCCRICSAVRGGCAHLISLLFSVSGGGEDWAGGSASCVEIVGSCASSTISWPLLPSSVDCTGVVVGSGGVRLSFIGSLSSELLSD